MPPARRQPKAAVAMRYDLAKDRAPKVVAKGKGEAAFRILELAKEHGIPVHEDPELIEALARLDIQQEIPAELYQVMAEVLTFIYRTSRKRAGEPGSLPPAGK
jgi:flagellar biosynthesis protein